MQSIYTYIPEKNFVPREYGVAAILLLLFMVFISSVPVLNLLYFYSSTFRSIYNNNNNNNNNNNYYYYYYFNNIYFTNSVMRGICRLWTDLLNTLIVQTKGDICKYIWVPVSE